VTVIALESFEEMPAALEEIEEAEAEGVTIRYRRGPHRVVGEGRVSGLETIGVVSVFDAQGRFAPEFAPDTEEVLPADTVILAVGQAPDVSFLPENANIDLTRFGGLAVDASLRTSHPKVWAGGDVAFGPRNLIDAIADGRRAAASIDAVLSGRSQPVEHEVAVELHVEPFFRRLATGYDGIARVTIPSVARDRRVGFAEVETGYDEAHAVLEGLRCLRCFDNIMLRPELCILCGLCVDVCPVDCITIVRADNAGVGLAEQSALLLDEELCIRCGLCVNRCPPAALVMVNAKEVVS
jgi:ferredoxin